MLQANRSYIDDSKYGLLSCLFCSVAVSNATGCLMAAALALMADALCSLAQLRSLTLTTSQPSHTYNAKHMLPDCGNVLANFLHAAAKHAAVFSLR